MALPPIQSWPTIGSIRRFGRLLVLAVDGRDMHGYTYYLCICDCGETRSVRADKLVSGRQVSCGCAKKDPVKRAAARMKLTAERRAEIAALGGRERVHDEGRDMSHVSDAKLANAQSRYRALWRKAQRGIARGWTWKCIAARLGTNPSMLRRARRYMESLPDLEEKR